VNLLAVIRPDDWNLPLFLHVLGAMLLVGGLTGAVSALVAGWRSEGLTLARFGFWSLLAVAFPAWWLMRLSAEWIASKEGFGGAGAEDPTWIGIGYITAELGGLLLLVSIILAGIGVRRMRRSETPRPGLLLRIPAVLAAIVLAAYVLAVWAMTVKP
jgi:hypothetical protein